MPNGGPQLPLGTPQLPTSPSRVGTWRRDGVYRLGCVSCGHVVSTCGFAAGHWEGGAPIQVHDFQIER